MLFFHFVCCATAWRLRCCSSPLFFHIFLIFRSADVSTGRLAAGASPSFDFFKRIFFGKFIFIKLELLGCSLGGIWHQVPPAGLELNLNKLARQGPCKVEGNCRRKTAIHLSSGNLTASYYRMACRWNLEQFLRKNKKIEWMKSPCRVAIISGNGLRPSRKNAVGNWWSRGRKLSLKWIFTLMDDSVAVCTCRRHFSL